ncbi:hypothetical protein [Ruminiclostridium josui]|uniref:hypothetical protein n=1 Tax=Ruminiclostridium josui TaxID=1499 RepID=UPI000466B39B|nr:hypothetical protein [Ruminiclostridium josui]
MRLKKIMLVIALCTTIITILCITSIYGIKKEKDTVLIDLQQAINISSKRAIEWNNQASLYFLTSVDNPNYKNNESGKNGRRRYWNIDYAVKNTNHHLLLTIHDGVIINCNQVNSLTLNENLINYSEIEMNSTYAVKAAIKKYNLNPGKEWAQGYHFVLNKIGGKTLLTVVGLDSNGNFAKVNFNTLIGNVESAFYKQIDSGTSQWMKWEVV